MMWRSAAIVLLGLLWGCEDLNDFRTSGDTVFHGEVIGSDSGSDATSFIRRGFESHTEMELTFDPSAAAGFDDGDGPAQVAGTVTTYLCPPEADLCDLEERTPGMFDRADLETIESLNHDALSQYDFPGAGRLRNYMLGARFSSGEVDRNAMVFVSLMDNRALEVRVIAPSVLDDQGEELQPPLFGVFLLNKRKP